ncbi:receptor-like cytosolic serine/threonine-protein kinase RBK2 isoform X1 [Nicotiana tabacum]|uniref:non-specific serine/threonine protein kinase n=2 Tax=Nicotiana TaxID=4085 RepID=A0A1S3Z8G5_TOBAC|nr:PREDICTED: receptor-like cytosolic serine/threonine-protein kinase RBK2 [Nicotiana sylvestris]XP_016460686.1 PREDICTED: receptor-like cytosolic serine/threonine-protein kinase RBK2 [Nicotiana tabacum]
METILEHSANSPCENTRNADEEESDEELFKIGHKLLFCASSISLSAEEFRSLSMGEDHMDEDSTREVIEEDKVYEESIREAPEDQTESESTTSKPSTSDSDGWQGFIKRLKKGPSIHLHTFHPNMPSLPSLPSLKMLSKRKSRSARRSMPMLPAPNLDVDLQYCFEANWKNFSLSELQQATDNFSPENLIGEGGYSEVYKGHLKDGQPVAVKRLTRGSQEEMTSDYLSELGILVHVKHPNIANVIGYGVEGGMHLVLPLSPHGSLANMLNGERGKLTWHIRYNIALGAAAGLAYLHEGCQRRIIHRDIKAANVLLTEDFEAQISDFGLAKWLPDKWTHLTVSQFEGTFGYLPPEFFMHGIVDEKTDVYAFGVLLLELISGRPALDESRNSVVMWAKPLLLGKKHNEIVDPSLGDAYDSEQLNQILMVASLCIQQDSADRPSMSQVEQMLIGDDGILQSKKKFKRWPPLKRRCAIELDALLESP